VRRLQMGHHVGMPLLPPLQPVERFALGRRAGDLYERFGGPAPPGGTGGLAGRRRWHDALRRVVGFAILAALRRLDPPWFARLLGELGRPWGVAEPRRFMFR